jgi:hypothetical protein
LQDILEGDAGLNAAQVGRRIVLPASFPGSPRFMMQAYQDAMAIVRALGIPDFFLRLLAIPIGLKSNQNCMRDRRLWIARIWSPGFSR